MLTHCESDNVSPQVPIPLPSHFIRVHTWDLVSVRSLPIRVVVGNASIGVRRALREMARRALGELIAMGVVGNVSGE
jgi:hypothetical protein